jgi:rhodanese-related sulfurtransferase
MRLLAATTKLAFVASHAVRQRGSSVSTNTNGLLGFRVAGVFEGRRCRHDTRVFSSSGGQEIMLTNIGKPEMEEIIEDYENGGREDSGYIVLDVREEHEVAFTGKLSPNTVTFPMQRIMKYNAFELDEDDFEEVFGFVKPSPDETLVISCAAGIRSVHVAQFAAKSGYGKLVNYKGGANEWFGPF